MSRQLPDVLAIADPQTGAIVIETDPNTGVPTWFTVGGTSLATPIFSAIWAMADQAAGELLGQAAPVVAALSPIAIRDVLPIRTTRRNTTASITFRAGTPTTYDPAEPFGLPASQKTGFLGALVFVGKVPFTGWNDVGFGLDSSLAAAPSRDNATGYGGRTACCSSGWGSCSCGGDKVRPPGRGSAPDGLHWKYVDGSELLGPSPRRFDLFEATLIRFLCLLPPAVDCRFDRPLRALFLRDETSSTPAFTSDFAAKRAHRESAPPRDSFRIYLQIGRWH
jgi:hypothetical protein